MGPHFSSLLFTTNNQSGALKELVGLTCQNKKKQLSFRLLSGQTNRSLVNINSNMEDKKESSYNLIQTHGQLERDVLLAHVTLVSSCDHKYSRQLLTKNPAPENLDIHFC